MSVLVAFGLSLIALGPVLYIFFLLDRDTDTRPDVGLDIFEPAAYDRGFDDDATEEQIYAGLELLRDTEPREDLTEVLPVVEPTQPLPVINQSPLARPIGGRTHPKAPVLPLRPIGPRVVAR